jgi:hypothetical protein
MAAEFGTGIVGHVEILVAKGVRDGVTSLVVEPHSQASFRVQLKGYHTDGLRPLTGTYAELEVHEPDSLETEHARAYWTPLRR